MSSHSTVAELVHGARGDGKEDNCDLDHGDDQQVEDLSDRSCAEARDLKIERNALGRGDDQLAVGERALHVRSIMSERDLPPGLDFRDRLTEGMARCGN